MASKVYLFATRAGTDKQDSSNRSDVSHDKVAYKEKGVSEDRNAMKSVHLPKRLLLAFLGVTAAARLASAQEICGTPACSIAAGDILATMDKSADPCNDFYQYACGGWLAANDVIPDDKTKVGTFYEVRDQLDEDVMDVVSAPIAVATDSDAVKNMKNHYAACIDEAAIDTAGYNGFLEFLINDEFGGWPMVQPGYNIDTSGFQWQEAAADNFRLFLTDALITTYVYIDSKDTANYAVYVDQPSLVLPRDFYLADDGSYDVYLEAYKNFIVDSARVIASANGVTNPQIGLLDLEGKANEIIALETALAGMTVSASDRRDPEALYNPTILADLKTEYTQIRWQEYMDQLFENVAAVTVPVPDSVKVINVEPDYFDAFNAAEADLDPVTVANYLYLRRLLSVADEGPQELRDILFAFNSLLSGQTVPTSRDISCASKVNSESKGFTYAVASEYIKKYVNLDTKDEADALVTDLRAAFDELLEESTWLGGDTKATAKGKLAQIEQLVAYPDWIFDDDLNGLYDNYATMQPDDHLGNIRSVKESVFNLYFNKFGTTPDRTEWITSPAVVNAFYSPDHNSISFPVGILQPPFLGAGYPRYVNYGAIGVVMGHEITHGFDDQGSLYDGTGLLGDWWSPEDRAAFEEKAQCVIDQYNGYSVDLDLDGDGNAETPQNVDGVQTQGENIADNGGIREAFRAYQKSVEALGEEQRLPGLDELSPEQTFFLAYAQVWCERATPENQLNQLLGDPHSPGKFRVLGPLSNSQDFADAFGCAVGDTYNPEGDKCVVW